MIGFPFSLKGDHITVNKSSVMLKDVVGAKTRNGMPAASAFKVAGSLNPAAFSART